MSSDKTDVDSEAPVSDSENETTDILSDTEEIEEFEEVYAQLIQIQSTHEQAIVLLERIQKQCSSMQEDAELDLDDIIEDLHQKSLITISKTGKNPFSSHLLAMIDSIKN